MINSTGKWFDRSPQMGLFFWSIFCGGWLLPVQDVQVSGGFDNTATSAESQSARSEENQLAIRHKCSWNVGQQSMVVLVVVVVAGAVLVLVALVLVGALVVVVLVAVVVAKVVLAPSLLVVPVLSDGNSK